MPGVMPKKKHSRRRAKGRWAHRSLIAASFSDCPQCRNPKLPHRVCPTCGYYNGREVVSAEELSDQA